MIKRLHRWLVRFVNWFHPEPALEEMRQPARVVLETFYERRRFTNDAGVEMVELIDQDGYLVYETAETFDRDYAPLDPSQK